MSTLVWCWPALAGDQAAFQEQAWGLSDQWPKLDQAVIQLHDDICAASKKLRGHYVSMLSLCWAGCARSCLSPVISK